eukprot:2415289-Pyramimonas_sp.AAC.1
MGSHDLIGVVFGLRCHGQQPDVGLRELEAELAPGVGRRQDFHADLLPRRSPDLHNHDGVDLVRNLAARALRRTVGRVRIRHGLSDGLCTLLSNQA